MAPCPVPDPSRPVSADSARVVHEWLAAVNAGDVQGVLARTAPDVTLVGPRGTARGH